MNSVDTYPGPPIRTTPRARLLAVAGSLLRPAQGVRGLTVQLQRAAPIAVFACASVYLPAVLCPTRRDLRSGHVR